MADPLSLTASIIAVLGVTDGISKALSKIRVVKNAPDELLALINEVSDFRVVLYDIERNFRNPPPSEFAMTELHSHLLDLINRGKMPLLQLEQMIEYQFKGVKTRDGHFKVSRIEWLRSKMVVERLRQTLRDTRQNIQSHMALITSTYQSRIGLTVNQVSIVTNEIQDIQVRNSSLITQQLDEQSRMLAAILSFQSESRNVPEARKPRRLSQMDIYPLSGSSVSPTTGSWSSINVKTYYKSENQHFSCDPSCKCRCHATRHIQTPSLLKTFIGALFIGYSGNPGAFRTCTVESCKALSNCKIGATYTFPSWLIRSVLISISVMYYPGGITTSLAVKNICPGNAPIFQYSISNDVDGIRRLFQECLARPSDIRGDTGMDALGHAVQYDSWEACKMLLDAGADPHTQNVSYRVTAFKHVWGKILAADEGEWDRYRTIFPENDDFETWQFSKLHKVVLGIIHRDLEEELLKPDTDINYTDSGGRTALAWASRRGDANAVALLINANADVNIADHQGNTPIQFVRNLRCLKLLLEAGASTKGSGDKSGNTVLHGLRAHYFRSTKKEALRLFLSSGADIEARNSLGSTPLSISSVYANGSISWMEALLDNGAFMDSLDNEGDTPLTNAIYYYQEECVALLLRRGAAYNLLNRNGDSTLHVLARYGNLQVLRAFDAANPRDLDTEIVNKQGKTARQEAMARLKKPEGFLVAFDKLLAGIHSRTRSGSSDPASSHSTEDGQASDAEDEFLDALERQ